jgi:hypothetical protein
MISLVQVSRAPIFQSAILTFVLAFGLSPLVLDGCLVSCHTHATAATPASPPCHHPATADGAHVRSSGAPCGHDHAPHPAVMTARGDTLRPDRELLPRVDSSIAMHHSHIALGLHPGAVWRAAANPESRIPNPCTGTTIPLRI